MAQYHQALEPLAEAAARTRRGVICLPVPLAPAGGLGWAERWGAGALRHKAFVLAQHGRLVRRIAATRGAGRPVLVREFSTVPLWLVAGALRRDRDRLLFVVNHNLQWALHGRTEARAFRRLDRAGFRFAFFETLDTPARRNWGFDPARHAALRFPVADRPADAPPLPPLRDRPLVGLAGHFRAEKGMADAIAALAREPRLRGRLAVGVPNPAEFLRARSAAPADALPLRIEDTAGDAGFHAFLARCAVVVLNYDPRTYAWRPSGLLADCAAAGTPVVIPDLPVQREQLTWPTPVGEVFQDLDDLPRAVFQALETGAAGGYDFDAYRRARGVATTAAVLDEIWSADVTADDADERG